MTDDLTTRAINTIRFLSADAVQQANSGHPGLPMGAAAMAFVLWTRHLHHNPRNPKWPGRDRFVLSGGHGSMLLYSLLHLTGYGLSLDEIKNFRQWNSKTPGHPEYGLTPGVETTSGPLGQGFATAVGMGIAQAHMAAEFSAELFDNYIYAIVTDGDLMEGVASEAASLAGHLKLGRLVFLYDNNHISIDGSTDLAFTEDRVARFAAYGWHTQTVEDGNDLEAVDRAIQAAKGDLRPSIIACRNHIGFGAPHKQDTAKAHGEALGDEELNAAKQNLGWPTEPRFFIPDDVLAFFRQAVEKGLQLEQAWNQKLAAFKAAKPDQAKTVERRLAGKLPADWEKVLPAFPADAKGMATRVSSGKVLSAISGTLTELIGGSADLTPSNNTKFDGAVDFQPSTPEGRYIHYGVREHAMGAALNGLALYGGLIPYGATFLIFSDYMKPAIRIAALSHIPSIFVFTHDSVGLGEDGPTHQPIEQLAGLRAIPNLLVIRPADANEVAQAWKIAIDQRERPSLMALTRQAVPVFDRSLTASAENVQKGAYVLASFGKKTPDIILMASGSEVSLVYEAGKQLADQGFSVRVVSFPSWDLFDEQDDAYRESVLPKAVTTRLSVEAGATFGWNRYVGAAGDIMGIDRFGASAPYKTIFEHYGMTVDNVYAHAKALLKTRKRARLKPQPRKVAKGRSVRKAVSRR
ncbi:MAG TPA: transketolase [Anaerolineales bacterium]|nr:transketolase [Anaerolineales bacterium]